MPREVSKYHMAALDVVNVLQAIKFKKNQYPLTCLFSLISNDKHLRIGNHYAAVRVLLKEKPLRTRRLCR